MPTTLRIVRIGKVASLVPSSGVLHPSTQSSEDVPLVWGARAGTAGGVGVGWTETDGKDVEGVGDGLFGNSSAGGSSQAARTTSARTIAGFFIG
jgi:hypothetical protein